MSPTPNQHKNTQTSNTSQTTPFDDIIREEVNKRVNSLFTRLQAIETYSKQLEQADKKIEELIQNTFTVLNRTSSLTKILHIGGYIVGSLSVITGLYLAIFQAENRSIYGLAAIAIIAGVILLIFLTRNNPLSDLDSRLKNLSALSYIYLGYFHQLYPLDAAFKKILAADKDVDPSEFEEMLQQIQDITDEAMVKIAHIPDKTDK